MLGVHCGDDVAQRRAAVHLVNAGGDHGGYRIALLGKLAAVLHDQLERLVVAAARQRALPAQLHMRRQHGAGAQQRAGLRRQRLRRRLALRNFPLAAAHLVGDLGRQLAALDHRPLVAVRGLSADDLDEGFARRRVLAELVGEEPPRFPEIGVGRAVGAVEELRGEMKVAVLPLVGVLVGLRGGAAILRIGECGGDVAGRERGAAQREVHARGEQRIHEAGGVADQHVAIAGE